MRVSWKNIVAKKKKKKELTFSKSLNRFLPVSRFDEREREREIKIGRAINEFLNRVDFDPLPPLDYKHNYKYNTR